LRRECHCPESRDDIRRKAQSGVNLPHNVQSIEVTHLLRGRSFRRFSIMVLEEQRFIHEDLERLEQAIADRVAEEPRNV
jgi:hypothetical protein